MLNRRRRRISSRTAPPTLHPYKFRVRTTEAASLNNRRDKSRSEEILCNQRRWKRRSSNHRHEQEESRSHQVTPLAIAAIAIGATIVTTRRLPMKMHHRIIILFNSVAGRTVRSQHEAVFLRDPVWWLSNPSFIRASGPREAGELHSPAPRKKASESARIQLK